MLVGQAKYAVEIFLDQSLPEDSIDVVYKDLMAERRNLVLIGMSGCGKSTLGKLAAEKLGKTFVDTDAEIIKRIGMSIADYFAAYGEDSFRKVESEVVQEISTQNNLVISTGGGVIKNPENIRWLKGNGTIIWIQRDPELLESGNGRPLVPDQEAVRRLYKERLPLYTAAAETIIENDGNEEEALQKIRQHLSKHNFVQIHFSYSNKNALSNHTGRFLIKDKQFFNGRFYYPGNINGKLQ